MRSTPTQVFAVLAFAAIAGAAGVAPMASGGSARHLTAMDVQGTWAGEFRSEVNPAFVSSVELRIDAAGLRRFHWIALVDGIPAAGGHGHHGRSCDPPRAPYRPRGAPLGRSRPAIGTRR